MANFFSAHSYRRGGLGRSLALSHLCLSALVIVPAAAEAMTPGPNDGSFSFGFAIVLIWVAFRGRRIRPLVPAAAPPPLNEVSEQPPWR